MDSLLTVTAPAASHSLTTIGAALAELGLPAGQAGAVAPLIAQASAAIASHVGRVLAREAVEEVFRVRERLPHLPLSRAPVAAVASVTIDGKALASDEWEVDAPAALIYRIEADERIWWAGRKIVVAYTGGWVLPGNAGANLPSDIERACLIAIAEAQAARGRDPRLRSESADGIGSQSWLDPSPEHGALPWAAAELLAPWRRVAL